MGISTIFLAVASLLLDFAVFALVLRWWYPQGLDGELEQLHWVWFSGLFLLWVLVRYIFGLFDFRSYDKLRTAVKVLLTAFVVMLLVGVVYFYTQPSLLITPRRFLLGLASLDFFVFASVALFLKKTVKFLEAPVFLLAGDENKELRSGQLIEQGKGVIEVLYNVSQLDSIPHGSLLVVDERFAIDEKAQGKLLEVKRNGGRFVRLVEFLETQERRVKLESVGDFWILEFGASKRVIYDRVKRVVDVVISSLGLLVFVLVFMPVAFGIKATSRGPIIFRQQRVGQFGQVFSIYKFRTMRVNAGNTWTQEGDARITTFGRFLRWLRLDELPQFWNILKGDMSLVGPRPEQTAIVEQMRTQIPFFDERHTVKPGLSGWAQLHVYASTLEETKLKLEYDLYYVKHRGFWFDVEIILKTLSHILLGSWR